jgi:hypothetical protein
MSGWMGGANGPRVDAAKKEDVMGSRANLVDRETLRVLGSLEDHDDPRKCYAELQERISAYRREGAAVPEALEVAERQLKAEMAAQSQGR